MIAAAQRPNVELSVIPQSSEGMASPLNSFVLYDERLVTVEIFSGAVVLRDPRDVSYHLQLFEYFLSHAIRGDDAIAFLRDVAHEFMRLRE